MVALGVLVVAVGHVGASAYEGVEERREPFLVLQCAVWVDVACAAKHAAVFHAQLKGHAPPAEAQVGGLAVVEHVLGVARLSVGEVFLPCVVGGHAVGTVSFDGEPSLGVGYGHIVCQAYAQLWYGPCIGPEGLRAAAQLLVLQLHGLLLAAYGGFYGLPPAFGVGLLHDEGTGVVVGCRHVDAIAPRELSRGVG